MKRKIFYTICLGIITTYCFATSAHESVVLTKRQECDLELLLNDGFAPLTGFLTQPDYESVVHTMRLADGAVWPMPIMLDVSEKTVQKLQVGDTIELKDSCFVTLATMEIEDIWKPNKKEEAQHVFGTTSTAHPAVHYLFKNMHDYYIGGPVTLVTMPRHYDYTELRRTPQELKEYFAQHGITKVVGFQTRNPMHRAHQAISMRAAQQHDAHLLIHPVVGMTKPGDIDYVTRIRCYKKILPYYPEGTVTLSVLPLAMRMAGPREALWHALIRKNYGCTHFIVGRDHAGPGKDENGKDFYGLYDAQELVAHFADEIGITLVPFQEMLYTLQDDKYKPADEIKPEDIIVKISGTQLRALLRNGQPIPSCFSYPEIIHELRRLYPQKDRRGLTLFFTGLSGAVKTTLASALMERLAEIQNRSITYLDDEVIRRHLSLEGTPTKNDRSINTRWVGYIASEITKNGGLTICSLIAPYEDDRQYNRNLISRCGGYIEIYVSAPAEIDDTYEVPTQPDVTIDTNEISLEESIDIILHYLYAQGYLKNNK